MEYRLGTSLKIKSGGETVELTCPNCNSKVNFGVFSNLERRIAPKFPLPLDCNNVYFLVCPNCASVFGVNEKKGDAFRKGSKLTIGNFDFEELTKFKVKDESDK